MNRIALWVLTIAVSSGAAELPNGTGKDVVEQICRGCHSLETITKVRHSKAEWRVVVDDMVARGAEGKEEQLNLAVDYLARNFGTGNDSWVTYSGALVCGLIAYAVVWRLQRPRPDARK